MESSNTVLGSINAYKSTAFYYDCNDIYINCEIYRGFVVSLVDVAPDSVNPKPCYFLLNPSYMWTLEQ